MLGVCIGALLTSVWPPSPRESFKYIYKIHIWSLVPIYVTLMTLLPITVVYKNTMVSIFPHLHGKKKSFWVRLEYCHSHSSILQVVLSRIVDDK